jgi:hypothetical protein
MHLLLVVFSVLVDTTLVVTSFLEVVFLASVLHENSIIIKEK